MSTSSVDNQTGIDDQEISLKESEAISRRYHLERTRRGMARRLWPALPPEPVEPWECLPARLIARLLHEPVIILEKLQMPRFAYRIALDVRKFHIGGGVP